MLDSVPGTLMLTDCLEQCQSNDSCSSVNYETGLCILFSSNADKLPGKEHSETGIRPSDAASSAARCVREKSENDDALLKTFTRKPFLPSNAERRAANERPHQEVFFSRKRVNHKKKPIISMKKALGEVDPAARCQ